MKSLLLRIINNYSYSQQLYEDGLLSRHFFGKRIRCFFTQVILRINSKCRFPVHFTSQILHPENIKMGRKVWQSFLLSGGCYIQANNGIVIGDNTIFASGVKIISANHDVSNLDKHILERSIKIGANCWIGSGAIILPGVEIGNDSIVGAGAVVTKSFPSESMIIGNPAKLYN